MQAQRTCEDTAPKCLVIIQNGNFYRGGHPHLPESWSPHKRDARRYSRDQIANVREHISAHTSGAPIQWDHEDLCIEPLRPYDGSGRPR